MQGSLNKVFYIGWVFLLYIASCHIADAPPTRDDSNPTQGEPQFLFLDSETTHIDFVNELTEGPNTNIMMYEYFYNGGGVALGDLNGDNMEDVYLTSNMGDNQLYLNRGNFEFENVTALSQSGGRRGPWKTGVSIVDINGDGRKDIYLCYSGALPAIKRRNQLFINMGNQEDGTPIFEDQARAYGLDSEAFSNQSYFFDYDRDGDLDMLLLNHNPKSLPILNPEQTRQLMETDDTLRGLRLYRNNNGYFEDVTISAGINGSPLSYGLGLGISDLDYDGWPDFYVSNDYMVPDYLYMNNGNGTFRNDIKSRLGHTSQFSMGNDIADINKDGMMDILTLDMLPEDNERQKLLVTADNYNKFDLNVASGFYYQYMRNMLHLNTATGSFKEIGQMLGIANTDWSWSALIADYNNDGWNDIYITNGYHRDYTNQDFINYMNEYVQGIDQLKRDDVLEIIKHIPASDVHNYMYKGGVGGFVNSTQSWGLSRASNSNGAAYADMDNDGDLDLVVNNINQRAWMLQNNTPENLNNNYIKVKLNGEGMNTQGIGARVTLFADEQVQVKEQYLSRGYLSSVSDIILFGIGGLEMVDSIVVEWPRGLREVRKNVEANDLIKLSESDAKQHNHQKVSIAPTYVAQPFRFESTAFALPINDFDRQKLLLKQYSQCGVVLATGDLNGDSIVDLIYAHGSSGELRMLLFDSDQDWEERTYQLSLPSGAEITDIAILNADGDGHADIYVGIGGYGQLEDYAEGLQDFLLISDDRGAYKYGEIPQRRRSTGTIAIKDLNNDGRDDIFVGGSVIPGSFPYASPSVLLMSDPTGGYVEVPIEITDLTLGHGIVTAAQFADLDVDGSIELIIAGEWMPILILSMEQGQLVDVSRKYFSEMSYGLWNTLELADFNEDGYLDIIAGNLGLNTQLKASIDMPMEMLAGDFDNNGSVDPLIFCQIGADIHPLVSRDELLSQLASYRPRFTTHAAYAKAGLRDLLSEVQQSQALRLRVDNLETTLYLSDGHGKFERRSLPEEVQYSSIKAMEIVDYNTDGHLDVILAGNEDRLKLSLGRLDANHGLLIRGDGQGGLYVVDDEVAGFNLQNNIITDVASVGGMLIFGDRNGDVITYRLTDRAQ